MNFTPLSDLIDAYQNAAEPVAEQITPYLLALLSVGFAVQTVWDLILWGVQDKPLFAYAVRRLLVFSVMFFLIANFQSWVPLLLQSFSFLGVKLTGLQSFSPEAVFRQGIALAIQIYFSWGNIFTRVLPGFAGFAETGFLIVVAAYGLIAFQMARVLIEAAIALSGLAIFLGFAGLRATWSLAEGYLKYVVEISVRLYVLFLLVDIGKNFGRDLAQELAQANDFNIRVHFAAILAAASFAAVVWILPNKMATAISGSFNFGGSPLADR
jgi:type IV secretion system protein TrbL